MVKKFVTEVFTIFELNFDNFFKLVYFKKILCFYSSKLKIKKNTFFFEFFYKNFAKKNNMKKKILL